MQNIEKTRFNWQTIIELVIVMGTIVGTTVPLYLHTDNKMQESIKEIRQERAEQNIKNDQQAAQQAARTDRLYEMFIDLLKEKR